LTNKTTITVTTAAALLAGKVEGCLDTTIPDNLRYTDAQRLHEHPWDIIVAHNTNHITGILTFSNSPAVTGHRPDMLWMQYIDVVPGHEGQGIGRGMIQTLFKEIMRRKATRLCVVFYSSDGEKRIAPIVDTLCRSIRKSGRDLKLDTGLNPI
jgi:hypothetical protein